MKNINNEFLKIDNYDLDKYVKEIKFQKKLALSAYNQIGSEPDIDLKFGHLHHFFTHVSIIIKIVFPRNNSKNVNNNFIQQRANFIQKKLGLENNFIYIDDIFIRNDLEHFAERLDHWVLNSENKNFIDKNDLPRNFIGGVEKEDELRNYDPTKEIFTFLGKEYKLNNLKTFLENF